MTDDALLVSHVDTRTLGTCEGLSGWKPDTTNEVFRWVETRDSNGEVNGFEQALLVSQKDEEFELQTGDGQIRTVHAADSWAVNPAQYDRSDDIADLPFLGEPAVIHNIEKRYLHDQIYTRSGLFLIAMNPFKHLNQVFSPETIRAVATDQYPPPHIFAVAHSAWTSLRSERKSQAILVTGESGAGKTFNTKMTLLFLTTAASPRSIDGTSADSWQGGRELEQQIIEANPALEAFGNALTIRNDNSSRFGKFIRVHCDERGSVCSASIQTYLLEKSRIAARHVQERSFHIFYQLLSSPEWRAKFKLESASPSAYRMLSPVPTSFHYVDDETTFTATVCALEVIGLNDSEKTDLLRIVAAILHLGEIRMGGSHQAHLMPPFDSVEVAAALLGVDKADLKRALINPRLRAGTAGEVIYQSRNPSQVHEEICALSRTLYERSFHALVSFLNRGLRSSARDSNGGIASINILDIAGFEFYSSNSLEQLLINHTNERLQQLFNTHFFHKEQELYANEGLQWTNIDFGLNLQPAIDLLEGVDPLGILASLDDEVILPGGTDEDLSRKLAERFGRAQLVSGNDRVFIPARQATKGFTIRHYADNVYYETQGWLAKNKDPLNADLLDILAASSDAFISGLFTQTSEVEMRSGRRIKKGAFRTLGQRHREDIDLLMGDLHQMRPHFVRCIVPNAAKRPRLVEAHLVLHQLRCNGVIEGLRVARRGWPNRLLFAQFCQRFKILGSSVEGVQQVARDRGSCIELCERICLPAESFAIGRTRIFFKAGMLARLDEQRQVFLSQLFSRFQAACRRSMAVRSLNGRLRPGDAKLPLVSGNTQEVWNSRLWLWWNIMFDLKPLFAASMGANEYQKRLERGLEQQQHRYKTREQMLHRQYAAQWYQLVQEHEKQLDSRQAQSERMALELSAVAEEMIQIKSQLSDVTVQRSEALDAEQQASIAQTEAERRLKLALQAIEDADLVAGAIEEQRVSLDRRVTQLLKERDVASQNAAALKRQIVELEQRLQQRNADIDRLKGHCETMSVDFKRSLAQVEVATAHEQEKLREALHAIEKSDRRVLELDLEVCSLTQKNTVAEADLQEGEARYLRLKATNQDMHREANDLRAQSAILFEERDIAAKKVTTLTRELESTRRSFADLQDDVRAKKVERDGYQEVMRGIGEENKRLGREIQLLRDEKAAIESAQSLDIAALRGRIENLTQERESLLSDLKTSLEDLHSARLETKELQLKLSHVTAQKATVDGSLQSLQIHFEEQSALLSRESERARLSEQAVKTSEERQWRLEDDLIKHEQGTAHHVLHAHQLASALTDAYNDMATMRETLQSAQNEVFSHLTSARDHDRQTQLLREQLRTTQDELNRATTCQDRKVVQHVHVLETAKKFTDQQLLEAQAALAASKAREQQLSKTKSRLLEEVEGLSRLQLSSQVSRHRSGTGRSYFQARTDEWSTNQISHMGDNLGQLAQSLIATVKAGVDIYIASGNGSGPLQEEAAQWLKSLHHIAQQIDYVALHSAESPIGGSTQTSERGHKALP